jgi:hypothetical protein
VKETATVMASVWASAMASEMGLARARGRETAMAMVSASGMV